MPRDFDDQTSSNQSNKATAAKSTSVLAAMSMAALAICASRQAESQTVTSSYGMSDQGIAGPSATSGTWSLGNTWISGPTTASVEVNAGYGYSSQSSSAQSATAGGTVEWTDTLVIGGPAGTSGTFVINDQVNVRITGTPTDSSTGAILTVFANDLTTGGSSLGSGQSYFYPCNPFPCVPSGSQSASFGFIGTAGHNIQLKFNFSSGVVAYPVFDPNFDNLSATLSASAFTTKITIPSGFSLTSQNSNLVAVNGGVNYPLQLQTALAKALGCPGNIPGGRSCSVGDPINAATGNVYEPVIDYVSGGQNRFTFGRYYNSRSVTDNMATFANSLGTNWRSTYDRFLNVTVTSVVAERQDGQVLTFMPNGSGGFTSDTDVDVTLTQSGSTYTLKDHGDNVETYTVFGTGQPLLTSIVARNGYKQTLSYNGSNQLTTVTDSYGRTLTLTYSGGLLNTVTTPGGLVLTYGYNSAGTQLTSVSYNTSPATSQTYLYENSSFPFALTGVTDELGHRVNTWSYDTFGRGTLSKRFKDSTNAIEATTVAYNNDSSVTVTNPLGQNETYKFTALQNVPKLTEIDRAANGTVAAASRTFGYDSNGYQNCSTRWMVSPQICSAVTNGDATQVTNNSHGQPTSITEAYGSSVARTTGITYDPTFVHLPSVITEPTRTTSIAYDGSGNVHTSTAADSLPTAYPSRTWTYTYNGTGEPLTAQDPRGNTTTMTYSSGNLSTVTDALGHVSNFTSYDADGRLKSMTDPNGLVTNLGYDLRGQLTSRAEGSSGTGFETTVLTRDKTEAVTQVQNPDSSVLTFGRDYAHRLTSITDSVNGVGNPGNQIQYTLDNAGNRTAVNVYDATSTLNRSHTYTFDALSRMRTDVDAYSNTTTYGYDNNGNRISVADPLGNTTTTIFDSLNRASTIKDPVGQSSGLVTFTTYNALNEPLTVTTPRGVVTTYTYNGFGDLTQLSSQDSGLTNYTYDLAGNVATKLDANGNSTANTYDALNRVTLASYTDALSNVTQSTYQWDTGGGSSAHTVGRLRSVTDPTPTGLSTNTTSFAYDLHGRVTWKQNNLTGGQTYGAAYDPVTGKLTSETYPSGEVIGYLYDAAGQQKEIDVNAALYPSTAQFITHITHQPFGPAASWDWVSNYTHYARTFNLNGDVVTLPLGTDTRTVGYDNARRVTSLSDTNSGITQTIGYDADSRITSYTGPFGNGNITGIGYDADGNRTCITSNVAGLSACSTPSTSSGTEAYAISSSSNQITSRTKSSGTTTYSYDGAGNTTAEGGYPFTYDVRDRQLSAGGAAMVYTYDGLGERIRKNGTAGGGRYAWAAAGKELTGRMLGQYSSANNVYDETIMIDGNLPVGGQPTGGAGATRDNTLRIFPGHEGEPRRATDNHANLYWTWDSDPFGVGAANQQPAGFSAFFDDMRFPGQMFDYEDSLDFNTTRAYDPPRGRYMQSDTIGLAGGINTYAYALNNSANNVDPSGEFVPAVPLIIGGAIGAASGAITTGNALGWSWDNAWKITGGGAVGAIAGAGGAITLGTEAVGLASSVLIGAAAGAGGDLAGQEYTNLVGHTSRAVDWCEVATQGVTGAGAGAFGALPVIALGEGFSYVGATYAGAFTVGLQSVIPADKGGYGWAQSHPARPQGEPLRITIHPAQPAQPQ